MSYWYEPERQDIELVGDEVHIFLGFDDGGNIYAKLKLADVLAALGLTTEGRV